MSGEKHIVNKVHFTECFERIFGKVDSKIRSSSFGSDVHSPAKGSGGSRGSTGKPEHQLADGNKAFTDDELDELQQIFEFYDVDNSKTMDMHELERAMQSLGYNLTRKEVEKISAIMDVDGDQSIDFSELCMIVDHMKQKNGEYDKLRDAFQYLDGNKDGKINCEDLYELMMTHAEGMPSSQVTDLIRFADQEGVGTIDYEAFIQMMKSEEDKFSDQEWKSDTYDRNLNENVLEESTLKNSEELNTNGNLDDLYTQKQPSDVPDDFTREGKRVDTVWKALGGPILINSAVIITYSKSRTRKIKWPSLWKILNYKRHAGSTRHAARKTFIPWTDNHVSYEKFDDAKSSNSNLFHSS